MKPVLREEILSIAEFNAQRPKLEQALLRTKQHRYVSVSPELLLAFENRETVRWQVHEMCRVENIQNEEGILHELQTYNALLPGTLELSATLMIGYADPLERDRRLRELIGLQHCLFLELGEERISARFDEDQYNTERISSVQFIRFSLNEHQKNLFLDLRVPARIAVEHSTLKIQALLSPSTRGALSEDLLGT